MKIDFDAKVVDSAITSLNPGDTFIYKTGKTKCGFDAYMIVNATDVHGEPLYVDENFPIACVNLKTGKICNFSSTCVIIPIKLKIVKDDGNKNKGDN